jgi:hypothetical protein
MTDSEYGTFWVQLQMDRLALSKGMADLIEKWHAVFKTCEYHCEEKGFKRNCKQNQRARGLYDVQYK